MKERMSRSNKRRSNFKINNMLATILAKQKHHNLSNNYLNIVFNGLFCDVDNYNNLSSSPVLSSPSSSIWQSGDVVTIEALLCKITKSKRKDSTSDFQEIWVSNKDGMYKQHYHFYSIMCITGYFISISL